MSRNATLYFPPLALELSICVVSAISIGFNAVVWLVIYNLHRRTRTPFLFSIGLLVIVEILLCCFRFVNGALCVAATVTNTIQLEPSWFDWPDIVLWGFAAVIQFIRNWWLVSITLFRTLMVCFPLQNVIPIHHAQIKRFFSGVCLSSLAIIATFLSQIMSGHNSEATISMTPDKSNVVITMFALTNASPTVLVMFFTICICIQLGNRCRKENVSALKDGDTEDQSVKTNRRATRTVLLIAICFMLFQMPLFITSVVFFNSIEPARYANSLYITLNLIYVDTLSNCGVMLASNHVFYKQFMARIGCLDAAAVDMTVSKRKRSSLLTSTSTTTSLLRSTSAQIIRKPSSKTSKFEAVEMQRLE